MKLGITKLESGKHIIPHASPSSGFQTIYCGQGRSRKGILQVNGVHLETPVLFPVLNLLTGPPSLHRNGATHKFLKRQLIFEDRRPGIMSEVLHFRDYPFPPRVFRQWFPHTAGHSEVKTLDHWVRSSFIELEKPDQVYKPLFFLDSGGFRLLFNREVDISEYGYTATPESILQLQLDYGADIVASLDYPIPPNLVEREAEERIRGSIENAVTLMKLLYFEKLTDLTGKRPFPFLAVHGQTPEQIRSCVLRLLSRLHEEGFTSEPFGIGIGSLVPLRVTHESQRIVMLVRAVVEALYSTDIPSQFSPSKIPIHAFGITGDMIPVLSYLGVDTFDSSSYIKAASVLDYYDPITWTPKSFRRLNSLNCNCAACVGITESELSTLKDVLSGERINGIKERLGYRIGQFVVDIKSDVYGIIAYHNLNLQDREIMRVRDAIVSGQMSQHVVRFSQVHQRAQDLIEFVASFDKIIAESLGHVRVELVAKSEEEIDRQPARISLSHNPADFDISTNDQYIPPTTKNKLLILACTNAKPYRSSGSHQKVFRFLQEHVGEELRKCHKVTLSGLYGPVPEEFEDHETILSYEYVLSSRAQSQQKLLVERLVCYLQRHLQHYQMIVAYVSAVAYRTVVQQAFEIVIENQRHSSASIPKPCLIIMPSETHGTGTKELYRHSNLAELTGHLFPGVQIPEQSSLF